MLPFAVVMLMGFLLLVFLIGIAVYFQHTAEGRKAALRSKLEDRRARRDEVDIEVLIKGTEEATEKARKVLE